jgi:hypothetical protein
VFAAYRSFGFQLCVTHLKQYLSCAVAEEVAIPSVDGCPRLVGIEPNCFLTIDQLRWDSGRTRDPSSAAAKQEQY